MERTLQCLPYREGSVAVVSFGSYGLQRGKLKHTFSKLQPGRGTPPQTLPEICGVQTDLCPPYCPAPWSPFCCLHMLCGKRCRGRACERGFMATEVFGEVFPSPGPISQAGKVYPMPRFSQWALLSSLWEGSVSALGQKSNSWVTLSIPNL